MAKLILGCGYLGLAVAERWLSAGDRVTALTRSPDRATQLAHLGIRPIVGDVTRAFSPPMDEPFDTVLYSVGYDRSSGLAQRDVTVDGLAATLQTLPESLGKLIYISSTGVYGQTAGEWVDETSACRPTRPGGRYALEAERLLAAHRLGARSVVLRLAGLYGPGRIPKLDAVRRGEPLAARPESWLNLIHRDDAVSAVLAAQRVAAPPRLYTVADGHPVRRGDFYAALAELVGAAPPRFRDDPAPADRDRSDKRVSDRRLTQELGVRWRYPTFREGLKSIVAQQRMAAG